MNLPPIARTLQSRHNGNRRFAELPYCIFCCLMLLGVLHLVFHLAFSERYLDGLIYSPSNFGDFWLHVDGIYRYGLEHIYEGGQDFCFPPLAYLYYAVFQRMCLCSAPGEVYRLSQMGYLITAFRYSALAVLLYAGVRGLLRKAKPVFPCLLTVCLLLSIPFWLAIERGNTVYEVLTLLLLAFSLRDRESRFQRETALLLIAVAANCKLYPALFGLVYLREKRYAEAIRLIIYGVLLFALPFLLVGGWNGFLGFLRNIGSVAGAWQPSVTNLGGIVDLLLPTSPAAGAIGKVVVGAYCAAVLFVLFFRRYDWKALFLLTSITIIAPKLAYGYTAVYCTLPLIAFLSACGAGEPSRTDTIKNGVYAALFGLVFFGFFIALGHLYVAAYLILYIALAFTLLDKLFEKPERPLASPASAGDPSRRASGNEPGDNHNIEVVV